ncbi:hypothetical protein DFJ58DRAFT_652140 [Suillus subalutaceus]|uniref:uncharacterized protein n=1 Tax=Suillus subalutaceus TaxID=48586 RepID=UPI001B877179|nr:uncharacterized protein DFJ58DRAFT_652140 [Suillus subalutaceus]KAG1872302.1 hypothetical protein DFJ58DRAFT_652140 [Suillus subalutaceus]
MICILYLQCALPVFEGLLPGNDNTMVLDLLFNLAAWHGIAKLQIHTKDTLSFFDAATVILGQTVRKFSHTTCKAYHMTELPHKYTMCSQWEAALASKLSDYSTKVVSSGLKWKKLNLMTYKYHTLGDYPNTIQ